MKIIFKVYIIGQRIKIPLINETKNYVLSEFLWPGRDPVLYSVLEFVVRVQALPFQMFLLGTKRMEIAGRDVRTVGWMIKLLSFKLDQLRVCEPGDVWTHVIMEQKHPPRTAPVFCF